MSYKEFAYYIHHEYNIMKTNANIEGRHQYVLPFTETCRHRLDIIENQYPPHPNVVIAAKSAAECAGLYPQPDAMYRDLVACTADYYGCHADNMIFTNGSDNALELLCRLFVTPSSKVVVPSPTYPHFLMFVETMYHKSVERVPIALGATSTDVCASIDIVLSRRHDNTSDVRKTNVGGNVMSDATASDSQQTNLVYICSPNLPLGYTLDTSDVEDLVSRHPRTMFILDEAYYEFARMQRTNIPLVVQYPNVAVTRTFSKAFGLAAYRLGSVVAHTSIVDKLRVLWNPKNVTTVACAAGVAALTHLDYYLHNVSKMQATRSLCRTLLATLVSGNPHGDAEIYDFHVSDGAWILLFAKDPAFVCNVFTEHGIMVRNKNDDVRGAVRVSLGTTRQMLEVITVCRLVNIRDTLRRVSCVLYDLDNTLRPGSKNCNAPYPAAHIASRPNAWVATNNATYTPVQIAQYFAKHNITVLPAHILSPLVAARAEMRAINAHPLIVGNADVIKYITCDTDASQCEASYYTAVIACDYFISADTALRLCEIARNGGTIYYAEDSEAVKVADCADINAPVYDDIVIPDVGLWVGWLRRNVPDAHLVSLGKPSPKMLCGVRPDVVVGDNFATDGALASSCGALYVHVDAAVSAARCEFGEQNYIVVPSLDSLV